ncbi:MAG: hypothetical protein KZQ76_08370 [Candidatus Thiodiazotropha sp. (ex Epidulcina cf. delphinae)]|nr:hypothetical protein [Candidatus Thiodiazotropha sp. (ex Epidulcina cf. delphinae)]
MALKKTVKKRRKARRNVVSIETIVEALQAEVTLSAANKRALSRLNAADKAIARQDTTLDSAGKRVSKARQAVADAKTPASKERARARLAEVQAKLKEIKVNRATLVSERRKAERLAKGLYKAMQTARTRMLKDYEKAAKSLEKAVDKRTRRRRRTVRKKAVEATE